MSKELRPYTYQVLEDDMRLLKKDFPNIETGSIGKSVWGSELRYIRIGSGETKIMYNGAHHGMEWITSAMLMKFAKEFLMASKRRRAFRGFNTEVLERKTSLYIIPMVNPDGVQLAAMGMPDSLSASERQKLIRYNGSDNFSRWQANARGVDLNHNYDALWQKSKAMEAEYGIYSPGPTRYSGLRPECEPESRALAEFTRKQDFYMTIAFHSQGKVIYHGFLGNEPPRSLAISKAFAKISAYKLDETEGIASYGGFKDWFVHKFNRPGFTVEVGEGKNPLPLGDLEKIYNETLPIMLGAMTITR